MWKLITIFTLIIFATVANAQKWECRDLDSGAVIVTLEKISDVSYEIDP